MTKSKRKSKNINRNTYPWQDYINQTNNKKESTLYITSFDNDVYICYIYVVDGEKKYTIECVGPKGCIFSGEFKNMSSAKTFSKKELEKRFNMKNMTFN
jgi:hypothetical protein